MMPKLDELDQALDTLADDHARQLVDQARRRLRCRGCEDCLPPDELAGLEEQPWWKQGPRCGPGRAA